MCLLSFQLTSLFALNFLKKANGWIAIFFFSTLYPTAQTVLFVPVDYMFHTNYY